ncbi:hypothetical protein EW146_g546 [Bondarzewia mesenterica]|uniref:Mif2/CENP-C cupin domain-containing protein n=1 Tax=Bondarzewia mesenterica TaxID=1095465 RepID=A0A4S4M8U5_9AGAM|nr:hypothetical protein EW146_g546 [Bondarzewia mesenterica]
MPASTRKSSFGTSRRLTEKAHIPYRRDDLQHGKKTGMAIRMVDHKSDDFEPFEEVVGQADTKTPPRARKGKKKSLIVEEFEEDVYGEMSMELDDSGFDTGSANVYFANARQPVPPSSVRRAASSSRRLSRISDVDFDNVPSPRPRSSLIHTQRSSMHGASSAGPSRLSQSAATHEFDEDVPMDDTIGGGFNDDGDDDFGDSGFEPYDPSTTNGHSESYAPPATPRRTSFTQIGQESDEEQEQEEHQTAMSNRSKGKGKGRAVNGYQDDDDGIEDDIQQGLDDVDMQDVNDESEPELEPGPSKKRKNEEDDQRKPKQPRGRKKDILVPLRSPPSPNPDGLRRGTRMRYKPLEYWRQEKVVYGRRESGVSFVPSIKAIVRIPKEPPKPLGITGKKHRRLSGPRSKSKTVDEPVIAYNPEEGWDEKTEPNGNVLDWATGQEVMRRIAFPARLVDYKSAINNEFFFQKTFSDGQYMAAGQLMIPPKGHKPSKLTKDNTYVRQSSPFLALIFLISVHIPRSQVFYIIEGAVTFKVHETSYILCTGGSILVPRGNNYYIENISDRDARLFFAQARRVPADEEPLPELQSPPAEVRRRSNSAGGSAAGRRSSSGGLGKKAKKSVSVRT